MFSMASLYDELEKIAEEAEAPARKLPALSTGQTIGAGAAGLMGSSLLGSIPNQVLVQNLQGDVSRSGLKTTAEGAEKLRQAIHPTGGMLLDPSIGRLGAQHARVHPGRVAQALTSEGVPEEAKKELSKALKGGLSMASPETGGHLMAHELGHGRLRTSGVGKVIGALRGPGMALGGLGGAAMATFADPESKVSKYAPLVGGLGALPTLVDEAYASLKGYGAMKGLGYSPEQLGHARRQLGKAFGTYATAAIPLVAAPYAIRKIKQHMQRRKAQRQAELLQE